jgi:hypothetical protein
LFLWAEDIDRLDWPVTSVTAPNSRGNGNDRASNGRQRTPKVPSHPHQASIGNLRSLLASEFESFDTGQTQPSNAVIWLPSVDGAPLSRRNVSRQIVSGTAAAANGGAARNGTDSKIGDDRRLSTADKPQPSLMSWQVTGLVLPAMAALRFLRPRPVPAAIESETAMIYRSGATLRSSPSRC